MVDASTIGGSALVASTEKETSLREGSAAETGRMRPAKEYRASGGKRKRGAGSKLPRRGRLGAERHKRGSRRKE